MRLALFVVAFALAPFIQVSADGGVGEGWMVVRFLGQGEVEAEISGAVAKDGLVAISLHTLDGSPKFRARALQVDPKVGAMVGAEQVRAGREIPPLDLVSTHPPITAGLTFEATDENYLVFVAAGDIDEWSVVLTNAIVLSETRGVGAFYSDGSDFIGGAAIIAEGPLSRVGIHAERTLAINFVDIPFLEVSPPSGSAGFQKTALWLEGPAVSAECPCRLNDLVGGAGSGEYVVSMTSLRAELGAADDVVWGADLRLPP